MVAIGNPFPPSDHKLFQPDQLQVKKKSYFKHKLFKKHFKPFKTEDKLKAANPRIAPCSSGGWLCGHGYLQDTLPACASRCAALSCSWRCCTVLGGVYWGVNNSIGHFPWLCCFLFPARLESPQGVWEAAGDTVGCRLCHSRGCGVHVVGEGDQTLFAHLNILSLSLPNVPATSMKFFPRKVCAALTRASMLSPCLLLFSVLFLISLSPVKIALTGMSFGSWSRLFFSPQGNLVLFQGHCLFELLL